VELSNKAAFFYYGHDDRRYGIADVFLALLRGLDQRLFKPVLIHSGRFGVKAQAGLKGIEVYQLERISLKGHVRSLWFLLWQIRPKVLVRGSEPANIICSFTKYVMPRKLSLVMSVHSSISHRMADMRRESKVWRLKKMMPRSYRYADKAVCVSEQTS
jgi:hypothetical protein